MCLLQFFACLHYFSETSPCSIICHVQSPTFILLRSSCTCSIQLRRGLPTPRWVCGFQFKTLLNNNQIISSLYVLKPFHVPRLYVSLYISLSYLFYFVVRKLSIFSVHAFQPINLLDDFPFESFQFLFIFLCWAHIFMLRMWLWVWWWFCISSFLWTA